MDSKKQKTIAFDMDGVIANYKGFIAPDVLGEPIEETVKAIKILKGKGYKILIYSTRGDRVIEDYCNKYDIPFDYINKRDDKYGENPGKPIAFAYVDDRGINFHNQKAEDLVQEIENFKSHWE